MNDGTRKHRRPPVNKGIPSESPVFICADCGETKDRSEFLFYSTGRPRSQCSACRDADYEINRDAYLARSKVQYRKRRPQALAYAVEYGKRWNAANPGSSAVRARRRRRRIGEGLSIPYTAEDLASRFAFYGATCWRCGLPADCSDHVKPIMHGGPDILANIRPACAQCNASKGWQWPLDTHVYGMPRSALRPLTVEVRPLRDLA